MRNCIESLLPGGDEVEILIVDDGSTKDNTAQIADEYERNYPGICRAIHQENGGHGEAVNAGLRNATGVYYKVVDSDDWVNEEAYMEVLDTLRKFVHDNVTLDMLITNFVYEKQGAKHKKVMNYNMALPKRQLIDWNGAREPYILGTENDTLNATSMLFMKLLTGRAQMFADVRTYWSGEAVKRVTGYEIEGKAKEADGFIHLINSGACCVDACGEVKDERGNAVMKKWWEVTDKDIDTMMNATTWPYADLGYFRGGGYSSRFVTRAEMPATMIRLNLIKGLGPVLQIVEGWTVKLPDEVTDKLWKRTDYTWPCTWFTPRVTGKGAFKSAYGVMNNWGANHGASTRATEKSGCSFTKVSISGTIS